MRSLLIAMLFLLPAPAFTQNAPGPGVPTTQEGPLRLELTFVGEQRLNFIEVPPGNEPPKSLLRIQFRLRGAELNRVVRHGSIIFSEFVDDTGHPLVDPAKYTEEQRAATRGVDVNEGVIQQGGLPIVEQVEVSSRGSKAIRSAKGELKVYLATSPEEVVVHRPLTASEGMIQNERLAALGVKIRVIRGGEEGIPNDNSSVGIQVLEGSDRVQAVEIYDDWLKAVPTRPRQMTTAAGEPYTLHRANAGQINPDAQFVLRVFPEMRTEVMKIDLQNLPLP